MTSAKFAYRPTPDRRKTILIWAAVAIVVSGLFPPWLYIFDRSGTSDQSGGHWEVSGGYACIFKPPDPDALLLQLRLVDDYKAFLGVKLDSARLLVEWSCILAASGAAWGLVRLNREQASMEKQRAESGGV